jgi:hypothetical protein
MKKEIGQAGMDRLLSVGLSSLGVPERKLAKERLLQMGEPTFSG